MMFDFDVQAVLSDLAERVSELEAKAEDQESMIDELRLGATTRPVDLGLDDYQDEYLLGEWDVS